MKQETAEARHQRWRKDAHKLLDEQIVYAEELNLSGFVELHLSMNHGKIQKVVETTKKYNQ